MAKKTKNPKIDKLIKKISALKAEHRKLTKQKDALEKVLDREGKVREKQLDKLDAAIVRAQDAYTKLDEKNLPSGPKHRKLGDKLYKIEDQVRGGENDLRALTAKATAAAKAASDDGERPDREAGDE